MTAKPLKSILFVCRHNSVRSQIAALLTEKISHASITANSAGPEPTAVPEYISQWATHLGHSAPLTSRSLEQVKDQPSDLIVTLCDKSHQALPELKTDQEHIRWDFRQADTIDDLKHLEIELAERIRLLLLIKGVI
ncbi:MAG: hypothetical protein ACRBB6_02010 [Neptuniibacter sp.]